MSNDAICIEVNESIIKLAIVVVLVGVIIINDKVFVVCTANAVMEMLELRLLMSVIVVVDVIIVGDNIVVLSTTNFIINAVICVKVLLLTSSHCCCVVVLVDVCVIGDIWSCFSTANAINAVICIDVVHASIQSLLLCCCSF